MKSLINRMLKKRIESTTEESYINNIVYMEKESWKSNMSEADIFKETIKYLNKLKLSKEKHPFLIDFRDRANRIFKEERYNREEINKLYHSLFDYRRELNSRLN